MEHLKEFTNQGYRIQLDLSRQVLGLDIPEEKWPAEEIPLLPTLPRGWSTGFLSAAALAMKAKQFDDGLYAATELAAQNGAGHYPGKTFLLRTLARSLTQATAADATEALAVLFGLAHTLLLIFKCGTPEWDGGEF